MLYLHSLGRSEYMSSRGTARFFYLNKILLYIIYLFLAILFSVSFICSFHVNCWSKKNTKELDRFFSLYFMVIDYKLSFGRRRGISSFLLVLWKNEYFVFLKFKHSLLAVNQSLMFTSSLFITVKRCLMSL